MNESACSMGQCDEDCTVKQATFENKLADWNIILLYNLCSELNDCSSQNIIIVIIVVFS